jgi:hypothetical protein
MLRFSSASKLAAGGITTWPNINISLPHSDRPIVFPVPFQSTGCTSFHVVKTLPPTMYLFVYCCATGGVCLRSVTTMWAPGWEGVRCGLGAARPVRASP